jgi:DNA-directed RNA polymerase II subunit RPB2
MVDENTVLVGRYIQGEKGEMADASITAQVWTRGIVEEVAVTVNNAGLSLVKIRITQDREPELGDKFSNRHGQKGTIGISLMQKDMPFTSEGLVPDLIMNPHCQPSRMTIGQLIECVASKEAAETGHFVDGTPFNNYDISQLPEALQKLGYSPYGTEKMYCGLTGRQMDVEIFIGPVYNIRLKHMVLDKVHGRARGPKQALTRQPLEGRSRDGGLKIGEMEKDAMVAHGMSQFLKERLMETSDISKVYVCDECGMFASKVIDKDYYRCKGCHNSTRISAVVIPHACKLLFQELTSVNILPRIRTERSIHGDES